VRLVQVKLDTDPGLGWDTHYDNSMGPEEKVLRPATRVLGPLEDMSASGLLRDHLGHQMGESAHALITKGGLAGKMAACLHVLLIFFGMARHYWGEVARDSDKMGAYPIDHRITLGKWPHDFNDLGVIRSRCVPCWKVPGNLRRKNLLDLWRVNLVGRIANPLNGRIGNPSYNIDCRCKKTEPFFCEPSRRGESLTSEPTSIPNEAEGGGAGGGGGFCRRRHGMPMKKTARLHLGLLLALLFVASPARAEVAIVDGGHGSRRIQLSGPTAMTSLLVHGKDGQQGPWIDLTRQVPFRVAAAPRGRRQCHRHRSPRSPTGRERVLVETMGRKCPARECGGLRPTADASTSRTNIIPLPAVSLQRLGLSRQGRGGKTASAVGVRF